MYGRYVVSAHAQHSWCGGWCAAAHLSLRDPADDRRLSALARLASLLARLWKSAAVSSGISYGSASVESRIRSEVPVRVMWILAVPSLSCSSQVAESRYR